MSDGAGTLFEELVRMLREARSRPEGAGGGRARQELYAEARRLLVGLLRSRVPAHVADDLAQDKVLRLVDHLVEDDVPEASVPSYMRRTVWNVANDYFRKNKRKREDGVDPSEMPSEPDDPTAWPRPPRNPEQEAIDEQDREIASRQQAKKRAEIELALEHRRMPARYRRVIQEHYFEGMSISELAEREMERKPRDRHGRSRTRAQVRDAVDHLLQRARDRLREIVKETRDGREGGKP